MITVMVKIAVSVVALVAVACAADNRRAKSQWRKMRQDTEPRNRPPTEPQDGFGYDWSNPKNG